MKINPCEKRRHAAGREKNEGLFLSPRRVSPFLAWGDFHARSRLARSNMPEEKWGTTRSLQTFANNLQRSRGRGDVEWFFNVLSVRINNSAEQFSNLPKIVNLAS